MKNFNQIQDEIESKITYTFKNKALLKAAFTHRSYWNENPDEGEHNERLEFLGDSLLNMLITDYLYSHLPEESEGVLSHLRAQLVDKQACHDYLSELDCAEYLRVGRGELTQEGKGRFSMQANLFEAIVGAIYLDGGFNAVRDFVLKHFKKIIERRLLSPEKNWKAQLQDLAQKEYRITPTYTLVDESGPPHARHFKMAVWLEERCLGEGQGSSKKEAQAAAAKEAFHRLQESTK
jgi:ribonuclease III